MNERIKELAEQAGLYDEKTPEEVPGFTASFEKFAELIVVKCANVVWDEAHKADNAEINDVGYKILEHFGVEE